MDQDLGEAGAIKLMRQALTDFKEVHSNFGLSELVTYKKYLLDISLGKESLPFSATIPAHQTHDWINENWSGFQGDLGELTNIANDIRLSAYQELASLRGFLLENIIWWLAMGYPFPQEKDFDRVANNVVHNYRIAHEYIVIIAWILVHRAEEIPRYIELENALDYQAESLDIFIEEGGKGIIRTVKNKLQPEPNNFDNFRDLVFQAIERVGISKESLRKIEFSGNKREDLNKLAKSFLT